MGRDESEEATELLKTIGDFERISDHAVNILSSAEEMEQKGLTFSGSALNELAILTSAIREILSLSLKSFSSQDVALAQQVRAARAGHRHAQRADAPRATSCACSRAIAALRLALSSPIF